jgi:hypothetical protein
MLQLLGRKRRPREWTDASPAALVAELSDGILCPQFRRPGEARDLRYYGLLDVDADFDAVVDGREPLVRGRAARSFADRKQLYAALWEHLATASGAEGASLRDVLRSVPAVWRACEAARAVAAELAAAGVPAVSYFSGKKGARVLFRSEECFASVDDAERYGDPIFEDRLPAFMRRHGVGAYAALRGLVDAAVYRPKSGIRADVHRRGTLFPTPLLDGPDGLDGPARRDCVGAAQRRAVLGFWTWCREAAGRVRPERVDAAGRGAKRSRAADADSVREARLGFHRAFAAVQAHACDGEAGMLPLTGLVPRAVRARVASGASARPTHCLQTCAHPNEEFIVPPDSGDPHDPGPAEDHVLRRMLGFADGAARRLAAQDDARIFAAARELGDWVERAAHPPPPLQEVVGAARAVRFFFDWDEIDATLEQLLCVQRAVEQVHSDSRMVVLTNTHHPAKRHLVFPALPLTPSHCGALARMVSDCREVRATFGDDAVPKIADVSPYTGYLRMPGCPKVCKRTGVIKPAGGVYWLEAVYDPGGRRRPLRELGDAAALYELGCLRPLRGQATVLLDCLERYDSDQRKAAGRLESAGATPRCSPRSSYFDLVQRSCAVVRKARFPERAFAVEALNAYYALPGIRKRLRRRGGGAPRALVEADLAPQLLPARDGRSALLSVRVPGVPCFCLVGQRLHRNAGANVTFLISADAMQQRCWHNQCRAMDRTQRQQRSPWVPIQTTARLTL